ncbi:uncharacterized protein LOC126845506 [Adelges cooleyi]|uniref:uncharacterized protein LOC126845506 n=1 Tax=Adelges cooleyi TaxID=133065 RepID=UPI002180983A|nr:uncharacterized protein LOC126845506 [Adelges cooleyi]
MTNINYFIFLCLTFYTPSVNSNPDKETAELLFQTIIKDINHHHKYASKYNKYATQLNGMTLRQFMDYIPEDSKNTAQIAASQRFGRFHFDTDTVPFTQIIDQDDFYGLIKKICNILTKEIDQYAGQIEDAIAIKNAKKKKLQNKLQ